MSHAKKKTHDIGSRFNKAIVMRQLKGLLSDPSKAEEVFKTLWYDFNMLKMAPHLKPRYRDDLPAEIFSDGLPKRIMYSLYWEWEQSTLVTVGHNYGVFIPNAIIDAYGSLEIVARVIAGRGVAGLIADLSGLTDPERVKLAGSITKLEEVLNMELRD